MIVIRNIVLLGVLLINIVNAQEINMKKFKLYSPTIEAGATLGKAQVANVFGCSGDNISPELRWENVPEGTKSFALTVYDPDAPTGSGFWHWMVINILATETGLVADAGNINEDKLPKGARNLRSDYGFYGFGGACPPEGDKPHRYEFTLFALNTDKLDLPEDVTTAVGGFMINAHTIEKTSFTAYFGR